MKLSSRRSRGKVVRGTWHKTGRRWRETASGAALSLWQEFAHSRIHVWTLLKADC